MPPSSCDRARRESGAPPIRDPYPLLEVLVEEGNRALDGVVGRGGAERRDVARALVVVALDRLVGGPPRLLVGDDLVVGDLGSSVNPRSSTGASPAAGSGPYPESATIVATEVSVTLSAVIAPSDDAHDADLALACGFERVRSAHERVVPVHGVRHV